MVVESPCPVWTTVSSARTCRTARYRLDDRREVAERASGGPRPAGEQGVPGEQHARSGTKKQHAPGDAPACAERRAGSGHHDLRTLGNQASGWRVRCVSPTAADRRGARRWMLGPVGELRGHPHVVVVGVAAQDRQELVGPPTPARIASTSCGASITTHSGRRRSTTRCCRPARSAVQRERSLGDDAGRCARSEDHDRAQHLTVVHAARTHPRPVERDRAR